MGSIKKKYILGAAVVLLLIWIISHSVSEPGVKDLKGNFKEVAMYRNENNTGPIQRIYAVTVDDTLWTEMEQYGNFMPHTKYGNTRVYFFKDGGSYPNSLTHESLNFDAATKANSVALYEKGPMGSVTFQRYPFRNLD